MPKKRKTQEEEPFEEIDQTSTNVDAVKEFINSNPTPDSDSPIPEDIQNMLGDKPKEDTDDDRVSLTPDKSFEDPDLRDPLKDMFISVKDTDIAVTEQDKTMYLKALLHDIPAELDVETKNGARAHCRALSVYESDLVYLALQKFLKEFKDYPTIMWDAQLQQYKMAMQIMSFGGNPIQYLHYEYGDGDLDSQVSDLLEKSKQMYLNTSTVKYGVMIRLMNVFNHKMNRLQEAAFNEDFWNPADTD